MRFLLISVILALLTLPVSGEEVGTAVTVSIRSAEMDAVTDELVVRSIIVSKASDTLVVTPILEVPDTIIVGPRAAQVRPMEETACLVMDSFDLSPGESQEVTFKLSPLGWRDALRLLLFRCRPADIRLRVRYEVTPGIVEHEQPTATATIAPTAPITGVIMGGLLGVVGIIAFVFVHRMVKSQPRLSLRDALLHVLLGGITVSLLAFLFRSGGEALPHTPLNIGARDYISGIVLGVAFQPSVGWLAKFARIDTFRRRKTEPTSSAEKTSGE